MQYHQRSIASSLSHGLNHSLAMLNLLTFDNVVQSLWTSTKLEIFPTILPLHPMDVQHLLHQSEEQLNAKVAFAFACVFFTRVP